MKTTSANLQAHMDGEELSLAWLLKVTDSGGTAHYWTSLDENITFSGDTYLSTQGFTVSSIQNASGFSVPQLSIQGALSGAAIGRDDIVRGTWDKAAFELALINYESVADGIQKHMAGWLGEISYTSDGRVTVELRGKSDALQHQVGSRYALTCQVPFGSAKCGIDLVPLTVTGSVTAVNDAHTSFTDNTRTESDGHFTYGLLTWTSGDNAGTKREVNKYDGVNDRFTFWLATEKPIKETDQYSVYPRCDLTFDDCVTLYGNAVNFRGFPHKPPQDHVVRVQAT